MKKNLKLIVFVILAVVSIGIYCIPEEREKIPTRILLDNLGGKVIFSHKMHAQNFGFGCGDCHHESSDPKEAVLACGTCHGTIPTNAELAEIAKTGDGKTPLGSMSYHNTALVTDKKACGTCHHLEFTQKDWGHDKHAEEFGLDCDSCHHSDTAIEPEPMNCNSCHGDEQEENTPSLKEAVHTKCSGCHQEWFDEGLKSCKKCHEERDTRKELVKNGDFTMNTDYAKCSKCHGTQEVQELVLNRMNAFHALCIGCHESLRINYLDGKNCTQCHTK